MRLDTDMIKTLIDRQDVPITQGELAEKIGMTPENLSRIMTGHVLHPRKKNIRALARALNVPVRMIIIDETVELDIENVAV